jgi:AraC-like DNA-binding protein
MTALAIPLPFVVALLAGLLVVALLRDSAASPRARLLFALFYVAVALLAVLNGLRWSYHLERAWQVGSLVAMTLGPLSYLAFRALTAAEWPGWPRVLVRHGWPVALAAAVLVWRGRWPGRPEIDPAITASFFTYAVLLWRLRAQGADALVNARLGNAVGALRMLTSVIWMHVLSGLVEIAAVASVLAGMRWLLPDLVGGFTLVLIAVLGWAVLGRAAAEATAQPDQAAAPELPTDEDARLVAALEALLAAQSLYRDPALTLARLARRLGVPARRVSQAVNRARGLNVSQFINNYRVAEAQRLLRETGQPVTEIMLEAGFQTKSNFNREFRRVTGESPSGWRGRQAA